MALLAKNSNAASLQHGYPSLKSHWRPNARLQLTSAKTSDSYSKTESYFAPPQEGASFRGWNVLELDRSDGYPVVNILNTTKLESLIG